jgi:hypothetical protein
VPEPDGTQVRQPCSAPAGELEEVLIEAWGEILGAAGAGAHDSFFDLGGDSRLAAGLAALVRDRLGFHLALRDLLLAPTPRSLAERMETVAPSLGRHRRR